MKTIFKTLVAVLALSFTTGCFDKQIIQKVEYKPSADLETIDFTLVFGDDIKIKFSKKQNVKDYGYVFIEKYESSEKPFKAGLNLKTSIVNEQDYIHLTPTNFLPNGVHNGLPVPLVEVRSPTPINENFDLMAYVDISRNPSWLGLAVLFSISDEVSIPADLTLTQVFKRDENGVPTIVAHVFGADFDQTDPSKRASAIALFANFRALLSDEKTQPNTTVELLPEPGMELTGEGAEELRANPAKLEKLREDVIRGLNKMK